MKGKKQTKKGIDDVDLVESFHVQTLDVNAFVIQFYTRDKKNLSIIYTTRWTLKISFIDDVQQLISNSKVCKV